MTSPDFPSNPPLVQVTRGGFVESQHRGAWVLTDREGRVLDGLGSFKSPFHARSTIKSIQVLPLFESGAVEALGISDVELALACASHNAEPAHVEPIRAFLQRLELDASDLQCGAQQPGDAEARSSLRESGQKPSALHNNCSGKHAGFLALARHLGQPTAEYLHPESPVQIAVRRAVADLCDVDLESLFPALDGCSAPTYRIPLTGLARAFARIANPQCLGAKRQAIYERLLDAVADHPRLIAGEHRRICTQLARVTKGRLFPKIGAEGVYVVGERGANRAFALKLDDGGLRGLHPFLIESLRRLEFLSGDEFSQLERWREHELRNWAGLSVGTIEVIA